MFNLFKKKTPPPEQPRQLPPVPDWQPNFAPELDKIIEIASYYTNGKHDLAIFEHGTIVVLAKGLSAEEATSSALEALHGVFHSHPDMNPRDMDDGNILVGYKNNVANIVVNDFAMEHWNEIDLNHQRALATHEVLITPLGHNVFNDFGKKALYGRCFMFMDALSPKVVRIARTDAPVSNA
ncbi:hypothetical protein GCM10009098_20420 [Rheinheimera aquimaris]|uniref:Uncharacterized protein n=1 Tax=Rheinheimera aquimaris TaxID=412437 RepID=A0ABP3NTW9_9GAMM|nr:hypothetical protein [Rheinheimera aquimaris]MCB5214055.1 hypothetical protein [Rheinheimera aquimaris]